MKNDKRTRRQEDKMTAFEQAGFVEAARRSLTRPIMRYSVKRAAHTPHS